MNSVIRYNILLSWLHWEFGLPQFEISTQPAFTARSPVNSGALLCSDQCHAVDFEWPAPLPRSQRPCSTSAH
jgi:hypothetical protein